MSGRITLDALNAADTTTFVARLGEAFEHSPWVAEAAAALRPFATVAALHEAMMAAVRARSEAEQRAFIGAHPDLAGKAARAGAIAPASVSEQAGLGLDKLTDAEFDRFEQMNAAYHARFGIPFVICVRRQTRDAVFAAFERRLGNDQAAELNAALDEIGHITRLRIVDLVEGPGAPKTTGRVSTHVLDTFHGRSAPGLRIELFEIGRTARAKLREIVTNEDGRTDGPVMGGDAPLRAGTYELLFHLGDYFRASGVALAATPFLDEVPIRFGVSEPEGHYHVPLVGTPWSYTTYRGS